MDLRARANDVGQGAPPLGRAPLGLEGNQKQNRQNFFGAVPGILKEDRPACFCFFIWVFPKQTARPTESMGFLLALQRLELRTMQSDGEDWQKKRSIPSMEP